MKPFPIFLNRLDTVRSIVIGSGHEAERKTGALLECDANVALISPDPSDQLRAWASDGAIEWIERDYEPGDLEGAFLVIVSEPNPERTRPIWQEAQERNVIISAMDDVPHCNFVSGSVVRRGPLVISISTSGSAPTLSVRMRQRMEKEFGVEYKRFLHVMHALRPPMKAHHDAFDTRRDLWYEVVDSDALDLIRQERFHDAYDRIAGIVGAEVVAEARATLRAEDQVLVAPAPAAAPTA